MARISGIDLPKNKRGEIGLTYIYGIGRSTAQGILEKAGIETLDENVKKMISLMSHKFLTDVAVGAFQYHKIFTKAAQKDKRFGKEKKTTLQIQDLEKSLKDMGIDIKRPSYYL